jgi:AraC-like DNA-binding protein
VIPRSGLLTIGLGRRSVVADAMTAVVAAAPPTLFAAHGRAAVIELAADWPRLRPGARVLSARDQLLVALRAQAGGGPALDVVLAVLSAPALTRAPRTVHAVRALLAASPAARWTLRRLGETVHASPYHLARRFRAATGLTVADYLHGLRMALALDRLARGEDDLARLAGELGFSGHSHLSERFRNTFGATPSQMRTILTARRGLPA